MKQLQQIEFCHNVSAGMSLGLMVQDETLYFALAFANLSKKDQFSRRIARNIISGRINAMIEGKSPDHSGWFEARNKDIRSIMEEIRVVFKYWTRERKNSNLIEGVFRDVETVFLDISDMLGSMNEYYPN